MDQKYTMRDYCLQVRNTHGKDCCELCVIWYFVFRQSKFRSYTLGSLVPDHVDYWLLKQSGLLDRTAVVYVKCSLMRSQQQTLHEKHYNTM